MLAVLLSAAVETWNPGEIVHIGDSITNGLGVTAGLEWRPLVYAQLQATLGAALTIHEAPLNKGVDGNTLTQMNARIAADVVAHFQSGARLKRGAAGNVATYFGGTNDAFFGVSANTQIDLWVAGCKAIRAGGFRVVAGDYLPCQGSGVDANFEANHTIYKAYQVAHPELYDAYVDFRALGAAMLDPTNTSVYQLDETHPNAAGHALMAPPIASAMIAAVSR